VLLRAVLGATEGGVSTPVVVALAPCRAWIWSWWVRRDLYDAHSQGDTVTALFTMNLG